MSPSFELGEPLFLSGNNPVKTYADANHLLFEDPKVNSIQVRKQGQNPVEVRISNPNAATGVEEGVWKPILELPFYGPSSKPVFPPTSVWAAWN